VEVRDEGTCEHPTHLKVGSLGNDTPGKKKCVIASPSPTESGWLKEGHCW
jgi:hypothetical protein